MATHLYYEEPITSMPSVSTGAGPVGLSSRSLSVMPGGMSSLLRTMGIKVRSLGGIPVSSGLGLVVFLLSGVMSSLAVMEIGRTLVSSALKAMGSVCVGSRGGAVSIGSVKMGIGRMVVGVECSLRSRSRMIGPAFGVTGVVQRVRDILCVEVQLPVLVAACDEAVVMSVIAVGRGSETVLLCFASVALSVGVVAEPRVQICCSIMMPRGRLVMRCGFVVFVGEDAVTTVCIDVTVMYGTGNPAGMGVLEL